MYVRGPLEEEQPFLVVIYKITVMSINLGVLTEIISPTSKDISSAACATYLRTAHAAATAGVLMSLSSDDTI